MTEPPLFGEKKMLRLVSPMPKTESVWPTGTLFTGMMVRVMMFQFSPGKGTTGCTLRLNIRRSYGPTPSLKLNCSGRLTRLASGF